MEREEEIKCASKDYVNYLLDKQEYHNEDYTEYDIWQAFEKGAMLADNNPDLSSLWHDASEIPRMNHKNIIYQTNYCSLFNVYIAFVPTCLRSGKITSYSWNEFVKDVNMRRWAYIKYLLPKGGKK